MRCTNACVGAEIIALSEAAKDMVYFRKLIRGVEPGAVPGPSELSTDNQAARDLSYNPENHQRTKHVERRHFFIRDMVEALELRVPLIPTKANPADFLTIHHFQRYHDAPNQVLPTSAHFAPTPTFNSHYKWRH